MGQRTNRLNAFVSAVARDATRIDAVERDELYFRLAFICFGIV